MTISISVSVIITVAVLWIDGQVFRQDDPHLLIAGGIGGKAAWQESRCNIEALSYERSFEGKLWYSIFILGLKAEVNSD